MEPSHEQQVQRRVLSGPDVDGHQAEEEEEEQKERHDDDGDDDTTAMDLCLRASGLLTGAFRTWSFDFGGDGGEGKHWSRLRLRLDVHFRVSELSSPK